MEIYQVHRFIWYLSKTKKILFRKISSDYLDYLLTLSTMLFTENTDDFYPDNKIKFNFNNNLQTTMTYNAHNLNELNIDKNTYIYQLLAVPECSCHVYNTYLFR